MNHLKLAVHNVFMLSLLLTLLSCHRTSRADQMRRQMYEKDSLQYIQALSTRNYSDSMLQVLMPQVDPLLQQFKYEKNDDYEQHGHYVHKLLTTDRNTSRNYLQAYVTDDNHLTLQSYYFGSQPLNQHTVKLTIGEDFVQAQGHNHTFQAEGNYEILTIPENDALRLLEQIAAHNEERIKVSLLGKREQIYYLQTNEKQALAHTYRLAVIMQDIATLERSVLTANKVIEKQQRKNNFQ